METNTSFAAGQPKAPISAVDAYKAYFKNYATFTGRSTRAEFWWPALFNVVIAMVLSVLASVTGFFLIVSYAFSLATLIPSLAVASRRLHDRGKAFGWYFICLIPLVGAIILLVWLAGKGEPGANRFGANPEE